MRRALAAVLLALACAAPAWASASGHRVSSAGISLDLPAGWARAVPHDGAVSDPVTRLAVASGEIVSARTGCQVAAYRFPSRAVAIVVLEWRHGVTGATRPRRFDARTLPVARAPAIECFRGGGGAVTFRAHGRNLGVYVLVGTKAPRALVARARSVLNTLRVRPR